MNGAHTLLWRGIKIYSKKHFNLPFWYFKIQTLSFSTSWRSWIWFRDEFYFHAIILFHLIAGQSPTLESENQRSEQFLGVIYKDLQKLDCSKNPILVTWGILLCGQHWLTACTLARKWQTRKRPIQFDCVKLWRPKPNWKKDLWIQRSSEKL